MKPMICAVDSPPSRRSDNLVQGSRFRSSTSRSSSRRSPRQLRRCQDSISRSERTRVNSTTVSRISLTDQKFQGIRGWFLRRPLTQRGQLHSRILIGTQLTRLPSRWIVLRERRDPQGSQSYKSRRRKMLRRMKRTSGTSWRLSTMYDPELWSKMLMTPWSLSLLLQMTSTRAWAKYGQPRPTTTIPQPWCSTCLL